MVTCSQLSVSLHQSLPSKGKPLNGTLKFTKDGKLGFVTHQRGKVGSFRHHTPIFRFLAINFGRDLEI